jgi:hypothetical protein
MTNVLDKSCRENQDTHFIFNNFFFFRKSCHLWDNVEKYDGVRGATSDVTKWRIRVACWKYKTTCTDAHAQAHTHGHTHACAQEHTHMSYLLLFHENNDSRKCLHVILYVHCLSCLVRWWMLKQSKPVTNLRRHTCLWLTNSMEQSASWEAKMS